MKKEGLRSSVAIVGGGAAGVMCAHTLEQEGRFAEIALFEARARVGGRIHRVEVGEEAMVVVDAGAAWVHGWTAKNLAAALADRLQLSGVRASKLGGRVIFMPTGKQVSGKKAHRGSQLFEQRDLGEPMDEEERCAFEFAKHAFQNYEGGKLEDLSTNPDLETEDLHGPHLIIEQGGYPHLLSILVDSLRVTDIRLNTKVTSIELADGGGVKINGKEVFDHVVVCLPLGVLQTEGPLMFSPPLSAPKTEALTELGAGCCEKLLLMFDRVFWKAASFGTDKLYISSVENVCQAPVLVVWTYSDEPTLDPRETADEIVKLWKPSGPPVQLKAWHQTSWGSDEFSRGSYSYNRPSSTPSTRARLAESTWNGSLHFAGEYTSKLAYGMVHGAMQEGKRAAQEILMARK